MRFLGLFSCPFPKLDINLIEAKLYRRTTISVQQVMRFFITDRHKDRKIENLLLIIYRSIKLISLIFYCQVIQLSQTNLSGVGKVDEIANHSLFKRALADEHETLLCLRMCAGTEDGARRLIDHPSGLFTVAVCVMSNFR